MSTPNAPRSPLRSFRALADRCWKNLKPQQLLALGFMTYALVGLLLVCIPAARTLHVSWIDNLFNVVSAISTTGLTTVSVHDSYTGFGQFVFLCLFQLGGIGYMTVSSFIVLARGQRLSTTRISILKAEFALPAGFDLHTFIRHVVLFTVVIEILGVAVLFYEFRDAGVADPLWSAIFHCVSAFATAGFSLNNDSLESFAANPVVQLTIAALAYLGAIGFIVIQDAWHTVRYRDHKITFTSRVILVTTAAIFLIAVPLVFFTDPLLQQMPVLHRLFAAAFQVMTASTTAGFNTVPISQLSAATLAVIIVIMVIGASPSGTGGGVKTTTFSSLLAVLLSTVRGRSNVTFWKHEIPPTRLFWAVASATLYLICLTLGVIALCLFERHPFLDIAFEAASGLGTVGLSMGITGSLTTIGKIIVIALMFIGRVGPLTIGLAMMYGPATRIIPPKADLAV